MSNVVIPPKGRSASMLSELQENIATITHVLNTDIKHLTVWGNIVSIDLSTDKLLYVIGLKGLPPIVHSKSKHENYNQYGLFLYETSCPPRVRYMVVRVEGDDYGPSTFICFPTEQEKNLRKSIKAKKRKKYSLEPPILPAGMLETIEGHTIGFLQNRKKLGKLGVRLRKGLILHGKAGGGKSLICRYLRARCNLLNIPFSSITASEIDSRFSKDELHKVFSRKGVVVFDDIDISYLNRAKGDGKRACAILAAMDGLEGESSCVRIFTSNEDLSDMDPAFLRPGRVDVVVNVPLPTEDLRRLFVERWPEELKKGLDIPELIRATEGHSFAEMEAVKSELASSVISTGLLDLERALLALAKTPTLRGRGKVGFAA